MLSINSLLDDFIEKYINSTMKLYTSEFIKVISSTMKGSLGKIMIDHIDYYMILLLFVIPHTRYMNPCILLYIINIEQFVIKSSIKI